jgi:hypothetical protein
MTNFLGKTKFNEVKEDSSKLDCRIPTTLELPCSKSSSKGRKEKEEEEEEVRGIIFKKT